MCNIIKESVIFSNSSFVNIFILDFNMPTLLDMIFPKSCTICSKYGEYLCDRCKKLFKKSIPECYICRRISGGYCTHEKCMRENSLDSMIVLWEYNKLSSTLLKKYKYGLATDVKDTLELLIKERMEEIYNIEYNKKAFCIPIPVSYRRLRERGFNQTDSIGRCIADFLNIKFSKDLVYRRDGSDVHQSLLDRDERFENKIDFYINSYELFEKIEEIVIVDDVITTGSTVEQVARVIKSVRRDIKVKGLCLFRGKPFYKKGEVETSP